jgi:hypothetical protein
LQIDPPHAAIKTNANWTVEAGFVVRERSMKRGAEVESQFLAGELRDIVGENPPGGLQIAAGVLGQMHHSIGLVDNDARRRQPFQRFAMNGRLNRRAEWSRRSRRRRLRPKCCNACPRRDTHLCRNGPALIDSRFPIDGAKRTDGTVRIFGRAKEEEAFSLQCKVECGADLTLHLAVEVDKDVATGDEVDA